MSSWVLFLQGDSAGDCAGVAAHISVCVTAQTGGSQGGLDAMLHLLGVMQELLAACVSHC